MDFFDVAFSTPTTRRYLDRPIDEAVLVRIFETANMAPSGSNAQPWEFVVVRAPELRRTFQRMYEELWVPYKETAIIRGRTQLSARAHNAIRIGDEFAASLGIVPVHVLVFLDRPKMRVVRGSPEDLTNFGATYGSIFPAMQNLMLAARALGIGSAVTTVLTQREAEVKKLVYVPDEYQLIAHMPLGYPAEEFKRPYRKSVFPRLHVDRWENRWPRPPSEPKR